MLEDWPYASKDKTELRAKLLAVLEREWERFQEHFDVVPLADNGNLEQVLDWYFDKTPPFRDGQKSKEFPDALVISALDKYCAEHKTKVAVISRDGDFAKASASRPCFEYCESLVGSHPIRDRVRFSAAVEIQADEEFKEFEDYSITYFSPESISIDADEHHDCD